MEKISFRGALSYDEILSLEVASFGDGAVTKIQFAERAGGPYWTVRANAALAGFMNAAVREDHLHIMHLEVAPEYRRRGIARRLLDAARLFAREADVSRMVLRVRADNEPARSLYLRYGFRETGCRQCRFACPVERLDAETDIRAERRGDGYKYPVSFLLGVREIGTGQFNEEVSGIKDICLGDAGCLLLPALAALRPLCKPDSKILYVMTDDDHMIRTCEDRALILQSTILDMEYPLDEPQEPGA